jgi:molybdopterin synthase catalytic subunit
VVIEVRILSEPVRAESLSPFPAEAGAECLFLGRTRHETHPRHGDLQRLAYEAYEGLAQRTLEALAAEAAERFGCLAVRVHHATGEVPVGEASVLVQVVTVHRDRSFEACRFLIDRLKQIAPIWKREVWADGTTWSAGTPVRT